MKRLLLLMLASGALHAGAQGWKVAPGTTFKLTGGHCTMVLRNAALELPAGTGPLDSLILKGSGTTATVRAAAPFSVHSIQTGMNAGAAMTLEQDLRVHNEVLMMTGLLDLNNHILELDSAAQLAGETNASRVIAPSGGELRIRQTLDAPLAENPGNLGLIITSGANLGSTLVRRGHQLQQGLGSRVSIARYYQVDPQFNTNLSAILRGYYLDAELNGQAEGQLRYSRSEDNGQRWTDAGRASINTTQNYVNLSGVQSMARFTLSDLANPLPVRLLRWEARCAGSEVRLEWETSASPDIRSYTVEKSDDALQWRVAGTLEAAGGPVYALTDATPAGWYRLVSHSSIGQDYFSPVLQVQCGEQPDSYELVRQPVKDELAVRATLSRGRTVQVRLLDLQSRLLYRGDHRLSAGASMLTVDVSRFIPGLYQLIISGPQGSDGWQTNVQVR